MDCRRSCSRFLTWTNIPVTNWGTIFVQVKKPCTIARVLGNSMAIAPTTHDSVGDESEPMDGEEDSDIGAISDNHTLVSSSAAARMFEPYHVCQLQFL